jgi:hypothetical protein
MIVNFEIQLDKFVEGESYSICIMRPDGTEEREFKGTLKGGGIDIQTSDCAPGDWTGIAEVYLISIPNTQRQLAASRSLPTTWTIPQTGEPRTVSFRVY